MPKTHFKKPFYYFLLILLSLISLTGLVQAVGSRLQAGAAPVAYWAFNEGSGSA